MVSFIPFHAENQLVSSVVAREEKQEWNNRAFSHSQMKNSTELKYSLSYCWPAGSHSGALWALFNKKSTQSLSPGHYNGKMWEYWKERDSTHWVVEVVADCLDNHVTLNPYSFSFSDLRRKKHDCRGGRDFSHGIRKTVLHVETGEKKLHSAYEKLITGL